MQAWRPLAARCRIASQRRDRSIHFVTEACGPTRALSSARTPVGRDRRARTIATTCYRRSTSHPPHLLPCRPRSLGFGGYFVAEQPRQNQGDSCRRCSSSPDLQTVTPFELDPQALWPHAGRPCARSSETIESSARRSLHTEGWSNSTNGVDQSSTRSGSIPSTWTKRLATAGEGRLPRSSNPHMCAFEIPICSAHETRLRPALSRFPRIMPPMPHGTRFADPPGCLVRGMA